MAIFWYFYFYNIGLNDESSNCFQARHYIWDR